MTDQPEKMPLTSMDIAAEKRDALKQLFPEVFAEDRIDFDQLKRVLGEWVEPGKERFGFTWPGKAECMRIIQSPSVATVKPVREESINFDETENVFIEGDNLEVLKLLQKAYFGKVKMIYIDPPYNTGNDFIYPDDYAETLETYLAYTGQIDATGKSFSTATDRVGRFHTRWLNMLFPRIYLAKNLLKENGVFCASINDREAANLKLLCDLIFGEENFIAQLVWNSEGNTDNQDVIKDNHEYVLMYVKNCDHTEEAIGFVVDPNTSEDSNLLKGYADNNITKNGPKNPPQIVELPVGFPCSEKELHLRAENVDDEFFAIAGRDKYISDQLKEEYGISGLPIRLTEIKVKDGKLTAPCRLFSGYANADKLKKYINGGLEPLFEDEDQIRFYLNRNGCIRYRKQRSKARNILSVLRNLGTVEKQRSRLKEKGIYFDYPKPVGLIKYLVSIGAQDPDSIVCDFFAGSATTAEAVIELNREDGGNRSFVLSQLPEPIDPSHQAYKAGYKDICALARARIAKLSRNDDHSQLVLESADGLDSGFRTFALGKSGMRVWDGATENLAQELDLHVQNVDPSATPEDIVYELLLKAGFPLTTKVTAREMAGKTVYSVEDGALLICLDKEISSELIDALAEADPLQVICLDEGFKGNDQLKANAVQTFKARAASRETEIVFRTV